MKNLEQLKAQYEALGKEIDKLEKEGEYPRYFKTIKNLYIVRFDNLHEYKVMFSVVTGDIGKGYTSAQPHTDTYIWQELPVCPKTGFYDTQLVWIWEDGWIVRSLGFYDAKNSRDFDTDGSRQGYAWDNYEPFTGTIEPWMIEAYSKLKID